jgi:hypothetical protein
MPVETTAEASAENIGAINPYALVEYKLGRTVNWKRIAEPRKLLEQTLGMPYEKLLDPREKSPLFAGKLTKQNGKEVRSKAPVEASGVVWADPGEFFDEAAEFFDPVQGAVGDCYLIAALASVGWARPYALAQRTRATGTTQQAFVDMIEFHKGGKSTRSR